MPSRHFRTDLLLDGEDDAGSNSERWILSYADFITLMFAFFVVMYSISSVNDGKFRVLSQTMVSVFRNPEVAAAVEQRLIERARAAGQQREPAGREPIALPEAIADPMLLEPDALGEVLATLMSEPIAEGRVRVRETTDWTEIELDGSFAFEAEAPGLRPDAGALLAQLADLARALDVPVRVEGFTDNLPRSGGIYGSNRALSAARAASVADALVAAGVAGERVAASGFGELHPVASNATDEGRRRNQRVVVAVARHDRVPSAAASAAAAGGLREQLPQRTLQRVTTLPAPAGIAL